MRFFFVSVFLFASVRSWSSEITVSGISSGAFMASQFYYAHNSQVTGLGLIAGGLYYCSGGSPNTALYGCMSTQVPRFNNTQILTTLSTLASQGWVDPLSSSREDRLIALSGQYDNTVQSEIVEQAVDLFGLTGGKKSAAKWIGDLPMGHAFPTMDFGNSCETASSSPYLSRCDVDGAGLILKYLHSDLRAPSPAKNENYYLVAQRIDGASSITSFSLAEDAVVYIPEACRGRTDCHIHIAFHGCGQTREQIGDQFIHQSGYSHWAEANKLVILYPQVRPNRNLMNPYGCWDWWGYTGPYFHTKSAPQIQAVQDLIETLQSSRFQLERKLNAN